MNSSIQKKMTNEPTNKGTVNQHKQQQNQAGQTVFLSSPSSSGFSLVSSGGQTQGFIR